MMRHIQYLCLRISKIHHFHTSSAARQPYRHTPRDNTGLSRRLKLIAENEPDLDKADIDEMSIEDLEQDIMQAASLNDEIVSEMKSISWQKQLKTTERKYFKPPKEPNMLTWSEKEYIKFLHQQDPEKWSPEVLAESFPASPEIIKKIIRAKWRPLTVERVKMHDEKVSENWKAFLKGNLEVHDLKLKQHLAKFTDRKNGVSIISDEEAKKVTEIILPKPKRSEFLSLVTSFKPENKSERSELENKRLEENIQPAKQIGHNSTYNIVDESQTYYTLDQYRKRLSLHANNSAETEEDIKAIIKSGNIENSEKETSNSEMYVAPSERFISDATVYNKGKLKQLTLRDPQNLKDRITIPKEKWKPGLVYRVNDCFYNDKGRFLYRVPGLKLE